MLAFDFENGDLHDIADEYAATPKQVKLAGIRSAKRTAGTIRRLSAGHLKTELGLRNATVLRRRIQEHRTDRRWSGYKVWFGANDLPISAFKGRPKKVSGGIMIGDNMIHGGFMMKIRGKRKVMYRYGALRGQIREAELPIGDRMISWLEDNVFADVSGIFLKHFVSEIRARTIYGVGSA
jgi:hypothetical protein